MKKIFVLVVLFSWPNFVFAASHTFACDSEKSTLVFVIENLTITENSNPNVETKATATLLSVRMPNYRSGIRTQLNGFRRPSAKGPYYELYGENDVEVLITAQANNYDEIKIGSTSIEVTCKK